jgi:hypothetical protein
VAAIATTLIIAIRKLKRETERLQLLLPADKATHLMIWIIMT